MIDKLKSEKSILLTFTEYGKRKQNEHVMSLPYNFIFIHDNVENIGQFIMKPNKESDLAIFQDKQIGLIYFNMTNDPYATPLSPIGNIGYHFIRVGLSRGEHFVKNGIFYYNTPDARDVNMDMNIPLKGVPNMHEKPDWYFEWRERKNTFQMMEVHFGVDMTCDIKVKHSIWDYEGNEGIFLMYKTNMQSILNGSTRYMFQGFNNKESLIAFHQSNRFPSAQ